MNVLIRFLVAAFSVCVVGGIALYGVSAVLGDFAVLGYATIVLGGLFSLAKAINS